MGRIRRSLPIRTDLTAPELISAYMWVRPMPSLLAASATVRSSFERRTGASPSLSSPARGRGRLWGGLTVTEREFRTASASWGGCATGVGGGFLAGRCTGCRAKIFGFRGEGVACVDRELLRGRLWGAVEFDVTGL